jgi:hypothetical protein
MLRSGQMFHLRHSCASLAEARASARPLNETFPRFAPAHHRQQPKHYLKAASLTHDEPVFALRVEQPWPIAGHPVWNTRSEFRERLGISRGHIHSCCEGLEAWKSLPLSLYVRH